MHVVRMMMMKVVMETLVLMMFKKVVMKMMRMIRIIC